MSVLFVIVTYNAMQWLERCLNSVIHSTVSADMYIVDNGSIDGTQDYVQTNYPQVIFQQSQENLGFGRANNVGLQYALDKGYDYVYLLNQDAWIMPDTLEKLMNIHRKYPEYGILSPFQMQANMQHLDINFARDVCSWQSNNSLLEELYLGKMTEVYSVPCVMAAHWFISQECLSKVGGFSPTFPHYGEDDNFADRTLYHGFKIGIVPKLKVVHDREDRKLTEEKEIYMTYISALITLSNICSVKKIKILRVLKSFLMKMFLYKSVQPIYFFLRTMKEYSQIKKNRAKSFRECAFLQKKLK